MAEQTGEELAALVSCADGTWVVVAPDGRFDTNNLDGFRRAPLGHARRPVHPAPARDFARDYYEPRLLPRLLAGEAFPEMRGLLDLNRARPKVHVASVTPDGDGTVAVTVQVREEERPFGLDAPVVRRSGAYDLHLFRDGQVVGVADGDLLGDGDAAGGPAETTRVFRGVRLPAGADSVRFTAYAFNGDRVKGATADTTVTIARPAPARRGTAYVVTFGADAFEADGLRDLSFAASDARLVGSALDSALTATGAYADVVTVTLTSPQGEPAHATRAALQAALARLAGRPSDAAALAGVAGAEALQPATPEDLVVLTFSTHGFADSTGTFHLVPSEAVQTAGRFDLSTGTISSDTLAVWLRGVDAGALAVVVDACHSGALAGEGFKPGPFGSRGLGQLAFDKGAVVLAASQAADVAWETSRLGHGLLTYALAVDGLRRSGADADSSGTVGVGEWAAFGSARVPVLHETVVSGGLLDDRGVEVGGAAEAERWQRPALFDYLPPRRASVPLARPGGP